MGSVYHKLRWRRFLVPGKEVPVAIDVGTYNTETLTEQPAVFAISNSNLLS
jgi:hypothetical protein